MNACKRAIDVNQERSMLSDVNAYIKWIFFTWSACTACIDSCSKAAPYKFEGTHAMPECSCAPPLMRTHILICAVDKAPAHVAYLNEANIAIHIAKHGKCLLFHKAMRSVSTHDGANSVFVHVLA